MALKTRDRRVRDSLKSAMEQRQQLQSHNNRLRHKNCSKPIIKKLMAIVQVAAAALIIITLKV